MTSQFRVNNPDAIEFTLTMTMTLGEWKLLKNQLADKFPSWDLSCQINSMVRQAEESFYPKDEPPIPAPAIRE